MIETLLKHISTQKEKILLWFLPLGILLVFMSLIWTPLLKHIRQDRLETLQFKKKVYQKAWLDSVAHHVSDDNIILQSHWLRISARISKYPSSQFQADSVRHLLDKHQLTVERLQSSEDTHLEPGRVEFKIFGHGHFIDYMDFLKELKVQNIPLYIDDIYIRQQEGGIQFSMSVMVHVMDHSPRIKKVL